MFGPKETITVKVKLYSGLDRLAQIDPYDSDSGIDLEMAKGANLKKVLKKMGLNRHGYVVCFVNGKESGLREKLQDKDVIFFMRPVSGG